MTNPTPNLADDTVLPTTARRYTDGASIITVTDSAADLGPTWAPVDDAPAKPKRAPRKSAPAPATKPATKRGKRPAAEQTPPAPETPPVDEAEHESEHELEQELQHTAAPNAEWTAGELIAFADEHEIDLRGATKQPEILTIIDEHLEEDDDE
ncbi:hypothetical protein [Leucobacter musarum]|uniref:hypothetical protein n=1 Tax=Leucobacter musarum TaxID=1930747 RepID=UPI0006A7EC09|nr:hypothetical protein [Leucobacter musarum]